MWPNASLKSIVNRHTGALFISAYDTTWRIVATASNIVWPFRPQC